VLAFSRVEAADFSLSRIQAADNISFAYKQRYKLTDYDVIAVSRVKLLILLYQQLCQGLNC